MIIKKKKSKKIRMISIKKIKTNKKTMIMTILISLFLSQVQTFENKKKIKENFIFFGYFKTYIIVSIYISYIYIYILIYKGKY